MTALKRKLLSIAACMVGCPIPSTHAQDAQVLIEGMRACAAEQDDTRRLSCYDKEFRQGGSPPAPLAGGAPSLTSAAAALTAEQRFGLNPQLERKEHGAPSESQQLDTLTSTVASVSHKARGEAVVTLDNGQVWEQADAEGQVLIRPGDSIRIRRGLLGSFWFSSPASHFRVRRVK